MLSVTIDNMSLVTAGYGQPTHRAEYDINFDAAVDQTLSALHFFLKKDTANTLDRTRIPARIYRPKRRCIRLRGPNRYDARGLPLLRVGLTARAKPGTPSNTTLTESDVSTPSILSYNQDVLFQTSFVPQGWHNFAIAVNFVNLTL